MRGKCLQVPGEARTASQVISVPDSLACNEIGGGRDLNCFLNTLNVRLLQASSCKSLCKRISTCKPTILQLGVSLLQLQLVSPRDG